MSKANVTKKVGQLDWEDGAVIDSVDAFFLKKTSKAFHIPKPNSPVVLLLSGGIDSIVIWDLLLEKYSLDVFPLHITNNSNLFKRLGLIRERNNIHRQMQAVHFFHTLFKNKYGNVRKPKIWHLQTSQGIDDFFLKANEQLHTDQLFDILFDLSSKEPRYLDRFIDPLHFYVAGYNYSKLLELKDNVHISRIFTGVLQGDGLSQKAQSLTSLRLLSLLFNFREMEKLTTLMSLAYEPQLGNLWEKKDLIKIGEKRGIPLEKAWSCYHGYRRQCGNKCSTCFYRKEAFNKAGIIDRTSYLH